MGVYGHMKLNPNESSPAPRLGGATPAQPQTIQQYKPVPTPQQVIATQSGSAAKLLNFIAKVTVNGAISQRKGNVPKRRAELIKPVT